MSGYVPVLQTDPASLERAMDFPQASVRQRAARVLQLLGVGGDAGPSKAPAAAGNPPPGDLLGGLDEPDVPQSTGNANDILGNSPPLPILSWSQSLMSLRHMGPSLWIHGHNNLQLTW